MDLKQIAVENENIMKEGLYVARGETVNLRYPETEVCNEEIQGKLVSKYNTEIIVSDKDSITQAMELEGSTVVLNFASYGHPGGGYLNGKTAQEECLCRQTTLYHSLKSVAWWYNHPKHYGLYGNDMILSKNIQIIRDIHNNLIKCDKEIGIITAAAPHKKTIKRYRGYLLVRVNDEMESRLDKIMALGASQGYENIVLGAFGCGVFGNDPMDVARMTKELLEGKYRGVFKTVALPIYKSQENYEAFVTVFKDYIQH